ncbi:hypothetical protein T265_03174 [Opisthorchis viverrini]|uniref:Uncharacterized protein n=1 Tax=Opisthorchis viverrini TaxID=6198 RepID=A0A074ZWY5_OPIVI|nr:hypothetical protein T265_03174 [Opisthorchis viverrini]KER30442.1 hypothetical protein T265_03174 [Opisthorchis viverrini]
MGTTFKKKRMKIVNGTNLDCLRLAQKVIELVKHIQTQIKDYITTSWARIEPYLYSSSSPLPKLLLWSVNSKNNEDELEKLRFGFPSINEVTQ